MPVALEEEVRLKEEEGVGEDERVDVLLREIVWEPVLDGVAVREDVAVDDTEEVRDEVGAEEDVLESVAEPV